MFKLNIVLHEPEIPQNTGSIVRTCAALGADLHLIKPLGFSMEDRYLKRAGLDYWPLATLELYENLDELFRKHRGGNFIYISKKADRTYDEADYSGNLYLVFGKESLGLPENLLRRNAERSFRIPMRAEARSLNLACAVTVTAYEAARRSGFPGLRRQGRLSGTDDGPSWT